ncbi:ABC transporter substrate-binding protein [Promicromonospora sp. NPDC060204]|uniref:ABC transporter substrate-binding protein n=1 Tax=Promicromonospora sp. NPDC060204 TaxID=3347071 RepID=UPI0036652CFD
MFLRQTRSRGVVALAAATVAGVLLAGCSGGGGNAPTTSNPYASAEGMDSANALVAEYPREETLFTSGTQWGPPTSWNPIPSSGHATGARGLLYEPLFQFDPITLELTPWLAEGGEWTGDKTYELTLREGLTWQDGETLDADDVVFTTELGKVDAVPYSNLWTWLDKVEATSPTTVKFTFSDPRYQEWDNWLYSTMVVPEHIMGDWSDEELLSNPNEDPIGSGAFKFSAVAQDRMVWERNDDWWARGELGLEMPMKYIVDVVNTSNEVALGLMLSGGLDLSNNFLPGVNQLVDTGQVSTYYEGEPYMLAAASANLIPNQTRPPMDDVDFRQALARSIDVDKIVTNAYGGLVAKAHPSGLVPAFEEYYDEDVVAEYGFTFDADEAKSILADAGYEDTDGDGFVETPDGEAIDLKLIVPAGWTDWMEAARVIAEDASAVGIKVTADFPDAGAVDDARATGDFDLVINGNAGVSNTPWTYYNYAFYQPIQEQMLAGNFGRYEDKEAWDLVENLSRTESGTPEFSETLSKVQEKFMTDLPAIPLWYNGAWAQYNESQWTNWPKEGREDAYFPIMWNGYVQMGGINTLLALEPAS